MKEKLGGKKKIQKSKPQTEDEDEDNPNKVPCKVCGKKFRSRYQLNIHLAVHTGEKNFICGICKKGFQQKWNLITHVRRVHSKEKPFKCNDCGRAFGYSSHFKRHVKTHFLEKIDASDDVKKLVLKPFKCKQCGKSYDSNYRLEIHLRSHSGTRPFVCDKCGKSFSTKRIWMEHMRKNHEENSLVCEHCKEKFTDRKTMLVHLKKEHNITQMKGSRKDVISCEICGKCVLRTNMNKHINIHTRKRVYKCRYCPKDFLESGQRIIHERKHTGEKPYVCDVCGKGHAQYGNLLTHRRRTHSLLDKVPNIWKNITSNVPEPEKPQSPAPSSPPSEEVIEPQYTGNETIEEFLQKASSWANEKFEQSKQSKTKEEEDEPEEQEPFNFSESSDSEQVDSSSEWPPPTETHSLTPKEMKIKLNNIIFEKIIEDLMTTPAKDEISKIVESIQSSTDVLKDFLKNIKKVPDNVVMQTKDETILWSCWMCESKLRSRHLLARHLIIHEPEENRPYRCDICFKTFTQSNNFKEHKMCHSNENQYHCSVCGMGFRHKTHFNTHMKRHDPTTARSPRKKHKCSYCGKKVHTKYQKTEHERTHTQERPFLCKDCGLQFTASSTLHRHQSIHSTASYECDICKKLFKQKIALKKHLQIHFRPPDSVVKCDCGTTFTQKHSLKRHKMICKNRDEPIVKPFECSICSKRFLTKSDLKRHMTTHDTTNKLICPVCDYPLKTPETFRRHLKRQHGVRTEIDKSDSESSS